MEYIRYCQIYKIRSCYIWLDSVRYCQISADPADGRGERVRENITISQGQGMMRANCKSQGSRPKKKARGNASEQGGSKRDKEDESKPTADSSKFQEQETRKKTPGARARRQDIRPSLAWSCFSMATRSVLEGWVPSLELDSCRFRKQP